MAFDKWIARLHPELTVGEAAQIALTSRLEGVVHFLPLAAHLAEEDVEYVHQLRVATRRATTALDLFAERLADRDRKRMRKALKQIRKSADQPRDLDVYLGRIESLEGKGAQQLTERLRRKRRRAQRTLLEVAMEHLGKERLKRRVAKLLKRIDTESDAAQTPFGQWCRDRLRDAWADLSRRMPEPVPTTEALHDFRIDVKQFRYAMELLGAGLGNAARDEIYPLVTRLQGELGALQDHAVAAEKLAGWQQESDQRKVRELLATLLASEQEQLLAKTAEFRDRWHTQGLRELEQAVQQALAASE